MKKYFLNQERDDYWISFSDLMTVLMVIFLFIAIAYMSILRKQNESYKYLIENYKILKENIYYDLYTEFEERLPVWNAELDISTLAIRFNEPEVLFKAGSAELKPFFQIVLDDFFPDYVRILNKTEYRHRIESIRIEGHTSSEWKANITGLPAYLFNMDLSQERTSNVLNYVLKINNIGKENNWVRNKTIAVGYSSSRLVKISNLENKKKSRRVEFRVVTDAENELASIMEVDGESIKSKVNKDIIFNAEKVKKNRKQLIERVKMRETLIASQKDVIQKELKDILKSKEDETLKIRRITIIDKIFKFFGAD